MYPELRSFSEGKGLLCRLTIVDGRLAGALRLSCLLSCLFVPRSGYPRTAKTGCVDEAEHD